MRAPIVLSLLSTTLLLAACADAPTTSTSIDIPVFMASGESHNFGSPLSGNEEVPSVDTRARGNAILTLSDDGTTLHYKLIVANIRDVTQAHIHLASAGANGPVVVFLYGFNPAGVTVNGILAEGDLTEANLIPRANIGFGGTMPELVAALRSGGGYVNVHTIAYPPGEIRGQVQENGPTK